MLLLLMWVGVTVSAVVDLQKRVIGGQPCQHQYHVKLRAVAAGGSYKLCGGSLISDKWILTAAHCFKPKGTMYAHLSVDPAQGVKIEAQPVIYTDNNHRSHDIMLLQLPNSTTIQPIALPDSLDSKPCLKIGETIQIAGQGASKGGPNDERRPSESPTLHCADLEVVSCENLSKTLQQNFPDVYNVKMYQHWFCGQAPSKDICFGDSGGGVVSNGKIYGVVSFLGNPKIVCTKASAFMDVCDEKYFSWIHKTIL